MLTLIFFCFLVTANALTIHLKAAAILYIASLAVLLAISLKHHDLKRNLRILLFGVFIIFCFQYLSGGQRVAAFEHKRDASWNGQECVIEGHLKRFPQMYQSRGRDRLKFDLHTRSILCGDQEFAYHGKVRISMPYKDEAPLIGDDLRISGTLRVPTRTMNEGEFDYRKYLQSLNVDYTLSSYRSLDWIRVDVEYQYLPLRCIQLFREWIRNRVMKLFDRPVSGMVSAMTTGSKADLDSDIRDLFAKVGMSHILAVSGLHVGLIAGFVYGLCILLRRTPQEALMVCSLAVFLMMILSGFQAPVIRAGLMFAGFVLGILKGHRSRLMALLLTAYFVTLLADPQKITSIGFQLSYLSLLGIVGFLSLESIQGSFLKFFGVCFSATWMTLPLVAYHFHIISWVSLGTNLLMMPILLIALKCAFLGIFIPGGSVFAWISSLLFEWSIGIFEVISQWPGTYDYVLPLSLKGLIFYYTATLLAFLIYKKIHLGWVSTTFVGMILFTGIIGVYRGFPQDKDHSLYVFHHPGSLLAHIQLAEESHWLLNVGSIYPKNTTDWVLTPYLKNRGISFVEGVFLPRTTPGRVRSFRSLQKDFHIERLLWLDSKFSVLEKSEYEFGEGSRAIVEGNFVESVFDDAYIVNLKGQNILLATTIDFDDEFSKTAALLRDYAVQGMVLSKMTGEISGEWIEILKNSDLQFVIINRPIEPLRRLKFEMQGVKVMSTSHIGGIRIYPSAEGFQFGFHLAS